MVRETPCRHLFHDVCLLKWVEQKPEEPDCPFCRAAIAFNN
jgi:E3 ubiquitin-protein ligase DOA10